MGGQLIDTRLHRLYVPRFEPLVDNPSVRFVLAAVHLDESLDWTVRVGQVGLCCEDGQRSIREHGRVSLDLHHVRMFGDRPKLRIPFERYLQDGRLVTDLLCCGMPPDGSAYAAGSAKIEPRLSMAVVTDLVPHFP